MKLRHPSFGFVLMVLVYSAGALFFAWGMAIPKQDRIWTIAQKIRAGNLSQTEPEDLLFFEHEISKNRSLANWLLAGRPGGLISPNVLGWVNKPTTVLVRIHTEPGPCFIEINPRGPKKLFPIKLRLRGLSWQLEKTFSTAGPQTIKIPPLNSEAEIIILNLLHPVTPPPLSMHLALICSETALINTQEGR